MLVESRSSRGSAAEVEAEENPEQRHPRHELGIDRSRHSLSRRLDLRGVGATVELRAPSASARGTRNTA